MRILFLNQYGETDDSPTAQLVADLAEYFRLEGFDVSVASSTKNYRKPTHGWRRWLREVAAHAEIFFQGIKSPPCQIIVSFSSPVCLIVTAQILAAWHSAKHVHWALDLYPDLAVALGELKKGWVKEWLKKIMSLAYDRCDGVVATEEDMHEYLLKEYQLKTRMIRPWPSVSLNLEEEKNLELQPLKLGFTWMYSGNLGRAHEWQPLLAVQALLEKEDIVATLHFQGGGFYMEKVTQEAQKMGLKNYRIQSYVKKSELIYSLLKADVLIATRNPRCCGMLWPSKLALLQSLPRPLLWVGDDQSHNARILRNRSQTGVFAPNQSEEIKNWLISISKNLPNSAYHFNVVDLKKEGLTQWKAILLKLAN